MNFNFLIKVCQRHFYLCSHLHVACKIIINYQNDSLHLISSKRDFLTLNFRNFLRAKLSASFLDLSNIVNILTNIILTKKAIILYVELNRLYYRFHNSKFKEKNFGFCWACRNIFRRIVNLAISYCQYHIVNMLLFYENQKRNRQELNMKLIYMIKN